jgi:hypothetical protein
MGGGEQHGAPSEAQGGGEQHGAPSEAQAAIAGSQHPASRITAPAASRATHTE